MCSGLIYNTSVVSIKMLGLLDDTTFLRSVYVASRTMDTSVEWLMGNPRLPSNLATAHLQSVVNVMNVM